MQTTFEKNRDRLKHLAEVQTVNRRIIQDILHGRYRSTYQGEEKQLLEMLEQENREYFQEFMELVDESSKINIAACHLSDSYSMRATSTEQAFQWFLENEYGKIKNKSIDLRQTKRRFLNGGGVSEEKLTGILLGNGFKIVSNRIWVK